MYCEILAPELELGPFPQLARITGVPERFPETTGVRPLAVSTWSPCVRFGAGDVCVGCVDQLGGRGREGRVDVQEVFRVEARDEGFELFHFVQLGLECVAEEDGEVFGGREEGC